MKLILILLLVYIGLRILKSFMAKPGRRHTHHEPRPEPSQTNPSSESEEMVFDAVCGSYVPISTAIAHREAGVVRYFCAEECRARFLQNSGGKNP